MDQEIPLHILLWGRGLSAGEHKLQWGLSVSLNVFWTFSELFSTGAYGSVCWKSFIFEVIWNLFYVMIVSGRLPNSARKRADAAKDHPGEENKMLSVVARGDGLGTSPTSRYTALPRGAEPQPCHQEWCWSGKGPLTHHLFPRGSWGHGDSAGRT